MTRGVQLFATYPEQRFERHQGAQAACLQEIAVDTDRLELNLAARI